MMTEAEWLSSHDTAEMLRTLTDRYASQRRRGESPDFERLRLFSCACCRRVWELLDDDHRKSVTMIEEYVKAPTTDGLRAARRVRWSAGNKASNDYDEVDRATPRDRRKCLIAWARNIASSAVWEAADKNPVKAANCHQSAAQALHAIALSQTLAISGPDPGYFGYEPPTDGEIIIQADILREIVGNSFASESAGKQRKPAPTRVAPVACTQATGVAKQQKARKQFVSMPFFCS